MKPDFAELRDAVAKVNQLLRDYQEAHEEDREVSARIFKDPDCAPQLIVNIGHVHARLM